MGKTTEEKCSYDKVELLMDQMNYSGIIYKYAEILTDEIEASYKKCHWDGRLVGKMDVYGENTIVINYIYYSATVDSSFDHEVSFVYTVEFKDNQACYPYLIDKEYLAAKLTSVSSNRLNDVSILLAEVLTFCDNIFLSSIKDGHMGDNLSYTLALLEKDGEELIEQGKFHQFISQTDSIISCLVVDRAQNAAVIYNMNPELYPNITEHVGYNDMMSTLQAICGTPAIPCSNNEVVQVRVMDDLVSCFRYLVKSGDTLSRIARNFDTTVDTLMDINTDTISDPDKIKAGQIIFIPVLSNSSQTNNVDKRNLIGITVESKLIYCWQYTLKKGDRIADIAEEYNATANDILKVNPNLGNIKAGDIILVPEGRSWWLDVINEQHRFTSPKDDKSNNLFFWSRTTEQAALNALYDPRITPTAGSSSDGTVTMSY